MALGLGSPPPVAGRKHEVVQTATYIEEEEELDKLAGQVEILEQAKLRLEMSLEEHRRQAAQREEELEHALCAAHTKVKALKGQLESEQEERTLLLHDKQLLERRLAEVEESARSQEQQLDEILDSADLSVVSYDGEVAVTLYTHRWENRELQNFMHQMMASLHYFYEWQRELQTVASLQEKLKEVNGRNMELEEELGKLAAQVQLLEQAKLRLEMSLEQQRKENRREAAQREEELEDACCAAHKKVKALEAQVESEHKVRRLLERRLADMEEAAQSQEQELKCLRHDLSHAKALFRDALEMVLDKTPHKAIVRQRWDEEPVQAAIISCFNSRYKLGKASYMLLKALADKIKDVQDHDQELHHSWKATNYECLLLKISRENVESKIDFCDNHQIPLNVITNDQEKELLLFIGPCRRRKILLASAGTILL